MHYEIAVSALSLEAVHGETVHGETVHDETVLAKLIHSTAAFSLD